MKFQDRLYQTTCVNKWYSALLNPALTPVIAVPTGAGKSVILCRLIMRWLEKFPDSHVLVLSHTKEIVEQDCEALSEFFPSFGLGIYLASLGRREVRKITVAGIHSVYNKPDLFSHFGLCIVDEAHAINTKDSGMYRSFFNDTSMRVTGMSATIYRTGHGYIHSGKDALFNNVAFDLTSVANFNRLVKEGYLTTLVSRGTELELDSSDIKKTGGDYNLKDLASKHDRASVTKEAVAELVRDGANYNKWLIFAIDISHCEHITEELRKHNILSDFVHSRMVEDRSEVIERFKSGPTRALVSVGVLTTGFDSPHIDLIGLLRPTESPVLHVQMIGRGLRVAEGKKHCLVLDFAGNTERLGPINNPLIKVKRQTKAEKEAKEPLTKKCPICRTLTFPVARFCKICGHEFLFKTKLKKTSKSMVDVVQQEDRWLSVVDVKYTIHHKKGKPTSLKVAYHTKVGVFNEWVCFNHQGYAKVKATKWLSRRAIGSVDEIGSTTELVYTNRDKIAKPAQIQVKRDKFKTVTNQRFNDDT